MEKQKQGIIIGLVSGLVLSWGIHYMLEPTTKRNITHNMNKAIEVSTTVSSVSRYYNILKAYESNDVSIAYTIQELNNIANTLDGIVGLTSSATSIRETIVLIQSGHQVNPSSKANDLVLKIDKWAESVKDDIKFGGYVLTRY